MASSVDLKYARALADVAGEVNAADQVHLELLQFQELLRDSSELRETLVNPAIPFSSKRRIIEQLAQRLGLLKMVVNFLLILLEKARIERFDGIIEAFQEVLDQQRGILRASVFTSRALHPSVRSKLHKAVSNWTGKEVTLNYQLDDSLIGGIKIQIGSEIFDGSIRTQLDEIQRRLAGR
jgi:F-type H+-transporting ATPase subunit delta